ncbi:peptide chain release factor N(5)-glutamine methyltransferase [Pelagibius marinus]|uniref:peptide chain release factor N(5)-glutamine methyltransferase n=1 Tax=Pelagibius marinus TaxID=2762760 RepID=UPI00187236E9|nr:peptide chain release factor N(5)-glutamine methyltransferase [Pelagibius marinus]
MTLAEAVAQAGARLAAAGIEDSRREARLLVCRLLGGGPELLLGSPERALTDGETGRIEAAVNRRAAREPLSRILGEREFWSLPFALNAATLDPRPDSETLVEAVLAEVAERDAALRLLDLGTGSGCLLLALLSELPAAQGCGIDLSAEAVAQAAANAQRLGLAARARFLRHSWDDGLALAPTPWDVIVSNPPYIASAEIAALAPEVAGYDPAAALDGGADGLEAYRSLIPAAAAVLAPGGLLALEIGQGQAAAVEELLVAAGLRPLRRARDLAGIERCLLAVAAAGG